MNSGPERDDDALFAELAEVQRVEDQPPAEVVDAAKELFTWRTVDEELAALTFDSLLDDEPAASRSTAVAPRLLTFEAGGITVELEVESGEGRRLVGQVVPPRDGDLELVADGRTDRVPIDDIGRFVIGLPDEPRRIGLRFTVGGRAISVVALL